MLIDLPNGAKWDTRLGFNHQSNEAKEYANSLLEVDPTNCITETLNDSDGELTRMLSCEHVDSENSLILKYERVYRYGDVRRGNAVKEFKYTLNTL